MAQISPFRIVHPSPESAAEVAAPPFDVLTRHEARRLANDKPHSFLRVSRAELELDDDISPNDDLVYRRGAANLRRLLDDGTMVQAQQPGYGVYRMTTGDHRQTGFVGLASLRAYADGRIRLHEQTLASRVEDRARLIREHRSHSGLVMMFADYTEALQRLLTAATAQPPYTSVVADGVTHEVWLVADPAAVMQIGTAVAALPALYVADGHHRSEAAHQTWLASDDAAAGADGYPVAVFPTDEVRTLSYNRVLTSLGETTGDQLLALIGQRYRLEPCAAPGNPAADGFDLYLSSRWHRARPPLSASRPISNAIDRHPASLLSDNVLAPLLGVVDQRADPRIDFVGGDVSPATLAAECDAGNIAAAFWLAPTPVAQLKAVADAGEVMPAKSTWFDPKLRDGLFVHLF